MNRINHWMLYGTDAIRIADEYQGDIELLVTNHKIEGTKSVERAAHLRARRPSLKVLQISGYPLSALAAQDYVVPDAGYLGKPFLPKNLAEKVREMLA